MLSMLRPNSGIQDLDVLRLGLQGDPPALEQFLEELPFVPVPAALIVLVLVPEIGMPQLHVARIRPAEDRVARIRRRGRQDAVIVIP